MSNQEIRDALHLCFENLSQGEDLMGSHGRSHQGRHWYQGRQERMVQDHLKCRNMLVFLRHDLRS